MSDNGKQSILEVTLDNGKITYTWGTSDLRTRCYIVKVLDIGIVDQILQAQVQPQSPIITPGANLPQSVIDRLK